MGLPHTENRKKKIKIQKHQKIWSIQKNMCLFMLKKKKINSST